MFWAKRFAKPLLVWVAALAISGPAAAWSTFTHSYLIQESLGPFAREMKLDQPLVIAPFENFLKKFSRNHPEVRTRDDFSNWLKINPHVPIERPGKNEKIGEKTTPLQILKAYAARTDDGRDKFLSHDPFEQFWFGSGAGTASQAFRHMEKPPFQILHPLNTFGFPLGKIGQATERAQIYFDLAVETYRLGEPYWAWNFLGCGLHYIQDLQNPYHSAQLLVPVLLKTFSTYWDWGHKMGLIPLITHLTSNLHHYFEGYVEWVVKPAKPLDPIMDHKKAWDEALRQPSEELRALFPIPTSIRQLARNIRDFSNQSSYDAVMATLKLSGENLVGPKDYSIGTESRPYPEKPPAYFNSDEAERKEAAAAIQKMLLSNFEFQGMALRTVVQTFQNSI